MKNNFRARALMAFSLLLVSISVFAGAKPAKPIRTIQHKTCYLNVLRLENFHFSPTAEKTLLDKGYKVIQIRPEAFAKDAQKDDMVLEFNANLASKKCSLFYDLELKSSVTIKQVISNHGELNCAVLDTREITSNKTITECQNKKLEISFTEDLGSCLQDNCGPLLEQLVQDIPVCVLN